MPNQSYLLKSKRFLPLFITQFFGAFNDNALKNALIILAIYSTALHSQINSELLVTIAAGLFILPYVLFSAIAGQLADKIEKSKLVRTIKWVELAIMIGASIGFYLENIWILLSILFLMGTHSTFFSPLKYSLIPDHLKTDEVLAGNSLIEAGTFIAILTGTIAGGLLIVHPLGNTIISTLLITLACVGILSSYFIPKSGPFSPALSINFNIFSETTILIKDAFQKRTIALCILGISWFWFIGATFLSQLPAFTKNVLSGGETVVTLLLSLFTIGVAIGSLLSHKLLKGEIKATYIPLGIIGVSVFTIDLYVASSQLHHEALMGISTLLHSPIRVRALADFFFIALSGGVFIVPLNAMLQVNTKETERARILAGNNVVNAFFMVLSSLLISALLAINISIPGILLTVGLINILVALYICKLLPETVIKSLLKVTLRCLFRVKVKGMENFHKAGDRVVIVVNHLSFIDPLFIATFLPGNVFYAINTHTAKTWWLKPFLSLINYYTVDPTNPLSTKELIREVQADKKLVIYPEGRLTMTGSLMKVYEGPGMIADKSNSPILPIRIDGLQYNPLSRLKGKVRMRWFPKVTITVLPHQTLNVNKAVAGRSRRKVIATQLYDIMSNMLFESSNYKQTLFNSLLDQCKIHGRKHAIIEDIQRKPLQYGQLLTRTYTLGKSIKKIATSKKMGILLPNSTSATTTFFGLHAYALTPVMLNYSTGTKNLLSSCKTAALQQIITSKQFIEAAKLEAVIDTLKENQFSIIYLEDIANTLNVANKLSAYMKSRLPKWILRRMHHSDASEAAAILFTSGSEGQPKGVVLSHTNIQANRYQLSSRIDFGPTDIVFNALPMFHSFGLTGGTLLPLLSGIKVFFYPSPLHYRIVPELIYDTNATIVFGTDTFLAGYARYANPYDFYSVRYVFAGAEKLKHETRQLWAEKYGVRIFEGYGATETSPILSANTPMHNKPGSVGRLMPSISYELQSVPGIETGGRLIVKGPNIMKGYLFSHTPGQLSAPAGGSYDTGDIVSVDEEGYLFIQGRAKRFAKIAGEMVSLTAVENYLDALWPCFQHAVISVPDQKKGEALVLVTTHKTADKEAIRAYTKANGLSELMQPKHMIHTDSLPLLGTGKVDYVAIQALASKSLGL